MSCFIVGVTTKNITTGNTGNFTVHIVWGTLRIYGNDLLLGLGLQLKR